MPARLVIGYGNPLRGDDGLGWDAALALQARHSHDAGLRVLTVHQLTPELAQDVSEVECVVFIDAAVDIEPGEVAVRPVEPQLTDPTGFTHHCAPATLLGLAGCVFGHAPAAAWMVTVGAEQFDCEECLSATVRAKLPEVLARVEALLDAAADRGAAACPGTGIPGL